MCCIAICDSLVFSWGVVLVRVSWGEREKNRQDCVMSQLVLLTTWCSALVNWKNCSFVYSGHTCIAFERQLLLISCKFYYSFFAPPPKFTLRRTASSASHSAVRSWRCISQLGRLSLGTQHTNLGSHRPWPCRKNARPIFEWRPVWTEEFLKYCMTFLFLSD